MATQYRTNSITNIKTRPRPAGNMENQEPAVLNSPPERRPSSPCTAATAAFERRIQNPTRSPLPRRAAPPPEPSSQVTVAAPPVIAAIPAPVAAPAAAAPVAAAVLPAPGTPGIESMFENDVATIESIGSVHVDTPAPGARKRFGGMRKSRGVMQLSAGGAANTGSSPQKGAGLKDSPAKQRRKWALAQRAGNDDLFGVRNRGSSDKIIREQGDNRSKACTELVETEKRFLSRLKYLQEVAEAVRKEPGMLTEEEFGTLFSNLDQIMFLAASLSRELEEAMSAFDPRTTAISPVLLRSLPFMKIFATYLFSYNAGQEIFGRIKEKKSLKAVLERVRIPGTTEGSNVQDMQNWLAEPFQRMMRYHVLVEEILRHTPSGHPDHRGTQQALEGFRDLGRQINEEVRVKEQSALYARIMETIHPADRERLEESSPSQRLLRFDGMFRALSEDKVVLDSSAEPPAESSSDLLMKELTVLACGSAKFAPVKATEPTAVATSVMAPVLSVPHLPRRNCVSHQDEQLAKYRSEQGGEDDSFDDIFEDDASRHLFLLSDMLVVAAVQGKDVVIESMVPLEVAWILPGDNLVVAWPAGLLHMAVDESLPRAVAALPARMNVSLQEWHAQLSQAIETHVSKDAAAAARRQGCSVWLENGHLAIEERMVQCARLHGESGLDAKAIESLAQQKPKKKVALKASIKNRLGFQ